ncbi:hypothetical protein TTHERM_00277180 (macronuclear) [Tetrahymena thermophila SB210]|uniref:Uncharacterized protein n=1 Tax=Tetrahymena thermophila (strain SB210) TaxID=312017 RepID=I7LVB9_TETTS|nr:hypothetical protein TTHERM_00277180 [Tetrahymena thermophila SB210]EAR97833.2 hypothetical protein TTHERM_00277180 [Tetrahymena thermophila SB210]|eukprot:XP_001018078.2 hypothetical protein TTHERM_00277180 [Tetrahymena thermophila SB210]
MDQICEENIQEVRDFIQPQLLPKMQTKSTSLSPMHKRMLKGIKPIQEQDVPQLNLRLVGSTSNTNSLNHIETSRNYSKDSQKKYINQLNYLSKDGNFTARNNYNAHFSSTKGSQWQEAYSPTETFTKMIARRTKKQTTLNNFITPQNRTNIGFEQSASLNQIRSSAYLQDQPDSAQERGKNMNLKNLEILSARNRSSEANIRLLRTRQSSQADISKYTAQQNSQIIQSLTYLDEYESKNLLKETKVEQKNHHFELIKELFKEIYPEYQTLRLGQKLHIQLLFGESKLIKIKTIDKNFPIVLRTFINSGYYTIYFSKKYHLNKPPDHFQHDYMMQQTDKTIILYEGINHSEEIKYIFMHVSSQTNCEIELIAQTQKYKEDIIHQNGSAKVLKQKNFIQFTSNDKIFKMEIAEIIKRRREKSLKMCKNKDFVKINQEVAVDYKNQIQQKAVIDNKMKAEKIAQAQKKQQELFEQKFEKNLQWLAKNEIKKQERLKIEEKQSKLKFYKTWITILHLPKIFQDLRLIIFKNKMWNIKIQRAKDLLNKFFKDVLIKLRSKTVQQKMLMYSTIALNVRAKLILQKAKKQSGFILQKFLFKSSETWLLQKKIELYKQKVRFIQSWYRELYSKRTDYLNILWNDTCNNIMINEKLSKQNGKKESTAKLIKRVSMLIKQNDPLLNDGNAKNYNVQIRISTINNEQKKASLKFFRRCLIERRVLMQKIKLGLVHLNNDIVEQSNLVNSYQSSQMSPLSPLENLNNSQSESNLSGNPLKSKKSATFFPSPPVSPLKAGKELQKITELKIINIKKVRKSKTSQKSPNQKNQANNGVFDFASSQDFINAKINVEKFNNFSINPYFMTDLSLQDKDRFLFYPTQPLSFLDTIKECLFTRKSKDIYVIKEDDENNLLQVVNKNKDQVQQQGNRMNFFQNKLNKLQLQSVNKKNTLDIKVLTFQNIAVAEQILFKKLILDASEQLKDFKGWKQ